MGCSPSKVEAPEQPSSPTSTKESRADRWEKAPQRASVGKADRYTFSDVQGSKSQAKQLQYVADQRLLLDATCHYLTYRQETEGLDKLLSSMKECGVGFVVRVGQGLV